MKCACGNEQGKKRVKPFPITIGGTKKGEEVELLYMAGMRPLEKGFQCWFCAFPLHGMAIFAPRP